MQGTNDFSIDIDRSFLITSDALTGIEFTVKSLISSLTEASIMTLCDWYL